MRKFLVFLLPLVALSGCGGEPHHVRLNDVGRILMHDSRTYTVFSRSQDTKEVRRTKLTLYDSSQMKIYEDVAPGDPQHVDYVEGTSVFGVTSVEVHLRNVDAIGGGGWNHGKAGRGQTEVLD